MLLVTFLLIKSTLVQTKASRNDVHFQGSSRENQHIVGTHNINYLNMRDLIPTQFNNSCGTFQINISKGH